MRFFIWFSCVFSFLILSTSYADEGGVRGIGVHLKNDDINLIENIISNNKLKSIRVDYPWSSVEKKRGSYDGISSKDELIKYVLSRKGTVLIVLDYGNPIYGISKPTTDKQQELFFKYVNWVSKKYAGKNVIFEIYNEWWQGMGDDYPSIVSSANDYASLVKGSSKTIRRNSPGSIIIAGSLNPFSNNQTTWIDQFLKSNVLKDDYIDGLSIHPYSVQGIKDNSFRIERFEKYFSNKYNDGVDIPIYITEMGFSSCYSSCERKNVIEGFIGDYMKFFNETSFLKGIWWYDLVDDGNNLSSKEDNYGIFDRDYHLKYNGFFNLFYKR